MDLSAQIEREEQMAAEGERRVRKSVEKAIARGAASETPAGVKLTTRALGPMITAIETFVHDALTKKGAGRRNSTAVHLKDVDPALAAYIAVKETIEGAVKNSTLKATAMSLATRLEMELVANKFEEANEALYRAIIRNATARGLAPSRQAKGVQLAAKKFGLVESLWTNQERVHIGTKLVELFIENGAPVKVAHMRERKDRIRVQIELTDEAGAWLKRYNAAAGLARPLFLPAVTPPKKWEGTTGGSYYSPVIRQRSVISRAFPGQLDLLEAGDLSPVYKGLNALQETPWRINGRVFEVMKKAWDKSLPLPCIPSAEDVALPERTEEVENDVVGGEHRKKYRAEAAAAHRENHKLRSRRFEFARGLQIAEDNVDREAIYFPHRCDFRGRAYAAATTLNPQGPDEIKALLEFAEAKPLGERGLYWLGVHGANLAGVDKVALDDRYAWACAHASAAKECAFDPLGNRWWASVDGGKKAWSFLAWCFEWAEAFGNPDYKSRLAVALDGSCNGIQHYSAMLRDEVGGSAVNLVPNDTPQDIYARVAERTRERVAAVLAAGEECDGDEEAVKKHVLHYSYAYGFSHFPLDRDVTKRPVMVLPYGGTFKSCMDYTGMAVEKKVKGGWEQPFGDDLRGASNWLAAQVWASIGEVVVSSREAMTWLQKVARITAAQNVPLTWTTPSGFVVRQDYREKRGKQIRTRFNGTALVFRDSEPTDEIDSSRQASSVAPNFVHSMDASAMMLTIGASVDRGITNFAMIHDSYGTHACDTDVLAMALRESFVGMYLTHDVLEEFEANAKASMPGVEFPPLPEKGALNIEHVLLSPYFFA